MSSSSHFPSSSGAGPSKGKGKSTTVSSSSFLNLKAEIARQKEEVAKARAAGNTNVRSNFGKGEKKLSLWAKQNKGINARNARDVELEAVSKPTLENARAVLERKAKLYEKLRKGKTGGLTDKQYDSLLVDFDQPHSGSDFESDSDDEDESATVPQQPLGDNDPMVEYEDEFGRIRTARKSEVPRNLVKRDDDVPPEPEFNPHVIYGDQGHFPVYEQDESRVREIEEQYAEAIKDPTKHYDASKENRTAGAAFYQFSADEETRARQMEELKRMREETEAARKEAGLDDAVSGGSAEAVRGKEESGAKITGRGMDKRKRELEERRRAVEAKRRKTAGGSSASAPTPASASASAPAAPSISVPPAKPAASNAADDFLAQLEADLQKK